jgi:hypothetical protein
MEKTIEILINFKKLKGVLDFISSISGNLREKKHLLQKSMVSRAECSDRKNDIEMDDFLNFRMLRP